MTSNISIYLGRKMIPIFSALVLIFRLDGILSLHMRHQSTTTPRRMEVNLNHSLVNDSAGAGDQSAKSPALRSKEYYQGTALEFLQDYGMHYHFFDLFFPNTSSLNQKLPESRQPRHRDIHEQYRVRDYLSWQSAVVASAAPQAWLLNLTFAYKPEVKDPEMLRYNNIFRFGSGPNERFLSIGFHGDPWADSASFVQFIGVDVDLPADRQYVCQFKPPAKAVTAVQVTRGLKDVINQPTKQNIVKCPVPLDVKRVLDQQLDEAEQLIRLDFSSIGKSMNNSAVKYDVMLADIAIPRLPALNRRKFKFMASSMIDYLDDAMVKEWIIYNILLGVEHFVLYYNTKERHVSLLDTILKPFLDANIVTLIYFPFTHHVFWNNIQHATLNAFLFQFGAYTEWVAYWDIDEFFLPNAPFLSSANDKSDTYDPSVLEIVTKALAPGTEPGIMFDMVEMGCDEKEKNFYLAGPGPHRRAVSVFCSKKGYSFHEMSQGHGKMLIRPAYVPYMHSPHRLNDYWVVWTNPFREGSMRHFDNFKYTKDMIALHQFSGADIKDDDSMRRFTLETLQRVVGVIAGNSAVR